jgi:hypothetical protein
VSVAHKEYKGLVVMKAKRVIGVMLAQRVLTEPKAIKATKVRRATRETEENVVLLAQKAAKETKVYQGRI